MNIMRYFGQKKIQDKLDLAISHRINIKDELEFLRCVAGNMMEISTQKYEEIVDSGIADQEDIDIAWEIMGKEREIILAEFNKAFQEL